jgi:hypothetical protein
MRAPRHLLTLSASALGLALGLSILEGCTSSAWYEHRFDPAPIEASVSNEGTPGSQVRALVTVIGIAHGKEGHPDAAVIRVRLENLGTVPAKFDPEGASLLTADLKAFGPAQAPPTAGQEIAPNGTGEYDLAFPTPEGKRPADLDLSGLNFRFALLFDGKRVVTGMTFQRTDWRYYDSYPHVQVGVGVGWYHVH